MSKTAIVAVEYCGLARPVPTSMGFDARECRTALALRQAGTAVYNAFKWVPNIGVSRNGILLFFQQMVVETIWVCALSAGDMEADVAC